MSDAQSTSTIVLTIHGPAGVVDLVVPEGATSVDVARVYAAEAGLTAMPLLQRPLGELLTADRALVDLGVEPGDLLVATVGVHRPRKRQALMDVVRAAPDAPRFAAFMVTLAVVVAGLAAWYAAQAGESIQRTVVVGALLVCALAAALPVGRHAPQRSSAAPAFGAAAAFAAFYEPGSHLLPAVVGVTALGAAAVAAIARAMAPADHEALTVWVVSGVVVFAVCGAGPLLEWSPRVSWTVLLVLAMLAVRFVPSLAVDVPDEALLDLERLAVTAWSARDVSKSRRGRIVVPESAIVRLVTTATRTVTAASAAVLVVMAVATPLLLQSATIDLDRIGARCLAFFAGGAVLLAARSYRHAASRTLLRAAGLSAWVALAFAMVPELGSRTLAWVVAVAVAVGAVVVAAAVATGRGWRSVRWSRRAELAESLCGSFTLASAVVAAGVFRALWEMTS
ncbi:hypothetical protein DDE18_12875 [Nocardioides gansuensis]|uniref:EccD-like transmembrane domain-containing protein n=1 Tax=Nocardioides gansuensis TaxID=2138300 RepID=A0A2T8F9F8_9ACTN|nr:hypothetical protein [Nocardioides gansuensis]PVG82368.1 hypothetical protein DDE18_12875 [Nocardioides gansuensis]